MNYLQAIVLGALQGVTEFLPISSDGHLFILRELLNWPDPGLLFDAILHLGTLVAVLIALWSEWQRFFRGAVSIVTRGQLWRTPDQKLFILVVIATVPAAIFGYFGEELFAQTFREVTWVALWFGVTGGFFLLVELLLKRLKPKQQTQTSAVGALIIGAAQATALLPGVSRSGTTIGTGLLLGLKREESARFSFVLAGPIVLGAVILSLNELRSMPAESVAWGPLILGIIVAAIVGVISIRWLLKFLKTRTLFPFAIYLLGLGLLLLILRTTAII